MTKVRVQEWDNEQCNWFPMCVFTDVDVRERTSDTLYHGPTLTFDIPDGHYGDGTQMVRRWTMESASRARLLNGPAWFEGFVWVETFDDVQTPDFEGYRKQRWEIE